MFRSPFQELDLFTIAVAAAWQCYTSAPLPPQWRIQNWSKGGFQVALVKVSDNRGVTLLIFVNRITCILVTQ